MILKTNTAPSILFLTTADPATIRAEWPYYQNWTLPSVLKSRGDVQVHIRCWRDDSLTPEVLAGYDNITFLWCNNYHEHPVAFPAFLLERLNPARHLSSTMRVVNNSDVVLWNTDKTYLQDVKKAGFLIPDTEVLEDINDHNFRSVGELADRISRSSIAVAAAGAAAVGKNGKGKGVVLKPSISGSSKQTYLLRDPNRLNDEDVAYLQAILRDGIDGSLMIQAYEPAIANGEYSMVYIAGDHTHTMVKTPARGEFRCQAEFGGQIAQIDNSLVPQAARQTATRILEYMESSFGAPLGYCRIDGVVRDDGSFVMMEIEAIEPHLWLETHADEKTKEKLYATLLGG
jgi:glutathione synthase/RimK-type ligase-like ATP-grasp enzyme